MYKGILFDLDGVICDTAVLHYKAWKKLANELGGDIDVEFNETLKGVDRAESLRRILAEINVELTDEEFNEMMTKKNEWYVEMLDSLTSADILPGIDKLLSDAKDNDIKMAIASASKNAPIILEKLGISKMFDTIANPADVKHNKPAPDIFLLAAKQLGLSTAECVGIEDSQAGIDALNEGDIDSIAIGDYLENATVKLSETAELTIEYIIG